MVKYDIFKIVDGLLEIDKEYVRGIPEFQSILMRDRGSKGDIDGRKKYRAFKEFYYIKITCDRFCYPAMSGLNEKETHKAGIKESDLEEDFKPDSAIKSAMIKFREIQDLTSPAINSIYTILCGLKISNVICTNIIKNIERTMELNEEKKSKDIEEGRPVDLAADLALTVSLSQQLETMYKIANTIPKTMETLEKLYDKLSKELSGVGMARGGKDIGTRAEPK